MPFSCVQASFPALVTMSVVAILGTNTILWPWVQEAAMLKPMMMKSLLRRYNCQN